MDANNKKLKFEGDIESTSGHIANYVISGNSLTSGNVGMSSDKAVGAKAFWAGSATSSNATFWVDNTGKLSCSNVYITGGYLKVGSKFEVTSDGILTAKNGKFSGDITASSISGGTIKGTTITGGSLNINNNFIVDANGNMNAKNGKFSGNISGSTITGGTMTGTVIRAGKNWDVSNDTSYMLYATSDELHLGNFKIEEYNGRYIFESEDEWTGMSPGLEDKARTVSLWANYYPSGNSYGEEYDFVVSQSGNVRVKNLIVYGVADIPEISLEKTTHWKNYTLSEVLDYIWSDSEYGLRYLGHEVRSLQKQVDDLYDSIQ